MAKENIDPTKEHIVDAEEFAELSKQGHQVVRIDFKNKQIIAPNKD